MCRSRLRVEPGSAFTGLLLSFSALDHIGLVLSQVSWQDVDRSRKANNGLFAVDHVVTVNNPVSGFILLRHVDS